ncbi:hypothetical protein FIV42_10290 [Persicimonas caeni]|uniref:Uncharacterized protein n=1 Tax=Persicimonas caeni TaxID=2292766 RepID=A0A4Y6PS12_PERCE|nr:hypothetical protein FIV42_10290 [Persicimonas caeni]QED32329.1 hypothetical protein FRD00_10285 [Persicimonas caeni]
MGDVVDGALEVISSGSLGQMLNTGLDKLGMPDWIGDIGGGVLDFCTGNWVGAAANGLDALEDVAKACGGDEIAGFLKAGSNITGMFAGGGLGKMGKAGELIDTATDSLGMVDDALGGIESLIDGDIMAAGQSLLDLTGGDLGPLENVVGEFSDEALGLLEEHIPQAKQLVSGLYSALEDGQLTLDDLQNDEVSELLGSVIGEEQLAGLEELAKPVIDFVHDGQSLVDELGLGSALEMSSLGQGLVGGVMDFVADQLEADHPDIAKLAAKRDFIGQLIQMGAADPNALGVLSDLLTQSGALDEVLDTLARHSASLRA